MVIVSQNQSTTPHSLVFPKSHKSRVLGNIKSNVVEYEVIIFTDKSVILKLEATNKNIMSKQF